jgi:SAM-dependent methyltransferase
MSFEVTAEAYARFMGRFSEPLAAEFAEWAGVRPGQHALDVGCGPGALTARLVHSLGVGAVAAIDPSLPFVGACRERFPGMDVRLGSAEALPFDDDAFDVALAQLVVHFMADPVAGLREMRRVTRPGGVVAACVWDHSGGGGPLSRFWEAAQDLDPQTPGEAALPGAREGELADLAHRAGLTSIESEVLTVRVHCRDFDEWWEPFTLGVGPAGSYVAGLDPVAREALRRHHAEQLPLGPFDVTASAWAVRAIA